MLKMSYREKIVALVLIVLVIVLIFVMWPIKTIRENIKKDTQQMESVQDIYDEKNRQINEIPILEKNITKIYDESKDLNKDFSKHLENNQIDEYIQSILNHENDYRDGDKNIFFIDKELDVDYADKDKFDFYYFKPSVIEYPILENANTNGTLLKDTNPVLFAKVENSLLGDTLEAQEIEKHSSEIQVKFTKEGLFKFIDELSKNKGMRVVEVTISNYRFGNLKSTELVNAIDENADNKGYTTGTIKFEFYTMQQIQEPKFD